jgi:hypothetical protein
MRSLGDIIRLNSKAKFQRQCEEEAMKRHNKSYKDLSDKQCARIAKDVKEKVLL